MRIIEFAPGGYRNLPIHPIFFTLHPERQPDNECSIRFLVGPNGVGKTNLLRFLAGVFLALNDDFRRPAPDNPAYSVPFTLVYQLRGNTVTVQSSGEGRSGVQFTVNDERREPGDLPARDSILPTALLVYTSGDTTGWQAAFRASEREPEEEGAPDFDQHELRLDEERPPAASANRYGGVESPDLTTAPDDASGDEEAEHSSLLRPIYLVEPQHLPLTLLSTLLHVQALHQRGEVVNTAFGETLREIDVRLLAFSLYIDLDATAQRPLGGRERQVLRRLYECATLPLQAWSRQQWVFELSHVRAETGQSTLAMLDEELVSDPFQFFQMLVQLQRIGVLRHVDLVLNYQPKGQEKHEPRSLLAESLSDGEFYFLARMALVYLLHENECLFLLDEPEVHFNDDWKRNLVDSIEQALSDTNSEVILTSHASVTLTDAFPDEVVLLGFSGQEQAPLTLGAEPGEILRRLFGSERTVGRRVIRRIEQIIQHGSDEALNQLLNEVGVGLYRFKIVEELQRRVSSDQPN